ncbi:MAG: TcaA 3rd/4th domain-containing protein [Sarcina sp.]
MTLKEKFLGEVTKFKTYMKNLKDKSDEKIEKLNNNEKTRRIRGNKYFKFWPLIIIAITLIIIIVGMNIMNDTKQEVINKFTLAVENNNPSKLQSILRLSNGEEISKAQTIPILNFFESDKNRVNDVKKALTSGSVDCSMSLKKNKKLIGENYYIEVAYKTLTIDSNLDNTNLIIDGQNMGSFNKQKTLQLIAPGEYKIELEHKNKYATISKNKNIDFTKDTKMDLNLDGTYVTVSSNVPQATVYINDASTGVEAKDFIDIGPFPTDGTYQVSLKYNTPFGSVSSDKVAIKDIPDIKLDIQLKNSGIETSLNNLIGKFYENVFNAIDVKDANKIEFANETAKNKIYSDIKEKGFILKNVYKLNSSSIDFSKSTVELKDGIYYANIVASIEYNVKKEILGVPLKSNNYTQNFFTKAKYQNGKWEIYEIENFDLKSVD